MDLQNKFEEFEVIRESIIQLQVCTKIEPGNEEILSDLVSQKRPSGTSMGWQVDKNYKPVQCLNDNEKWHYILSC